MNIFVKPYVNVVKGHEVGPGKLTNETDAQEALSSGNEEISEGDNDAAMSKDLKSND